MLNSSFYHLHIRPYLIELKYFAHTKLSDWLSWMENGNIVVLWLKFKIRCRKRSDKRSNALTMFDRWFLMHDFLHFFLLFFLNENFKSFVCNRNLRHVFSMVEIFIHVENISFVFGFVSILKKKKQKQKHFGICIELQYSQAK